MRLLEDFGGKYEGFGIDSNDRKSIYTLVLGVKKE